MKKITIETNDKQTIIMAREIISLTDGVLTYEAKRDKMGAISIYSDDKVTIETAEEKRDWVVVAGKNTRTIYAITEGMALEGAHIILQDLLTEKEAEELAGQIVDMITDYKF